MRKNLLGSCLQYNQIESHHISKSTRHRITYLLKGVVKFLIEE